MNDAWGELRPVAGANVLDKRFSGGADPGGQIDSTAAFQAAIDALPSGGGTLRVPPGTYKCDAGKLRVRPGLHLEGAGYLCTKISCNAAGQAAPAYLFNLDPPAYRDAVNHVDDLHITGLDLDCSGADIFWGANLARAKITGNRLFQRSPNFRIFHSDATTGTVAAGSGKPAGYVAECEFSNTERVEGGARSVESWLIDRTGTEFAANDNLWHKGHSKIWTQPGAYWMRLIGGPGTATGSRHNTWRDLVFECAAGTGGLLWLQSTTHALIDNISSEDQPAGGVTDALIRIGAPGTAGCLAITIRSYTRRATAGATAQHPDILLDQSSSQVTINAPRGPARGGQALAVDLGGAAGVVLDGAWPAAYTLANRAADTLGPGVTEAGTAWTELALVNGYTQGTPVLEARMIGRDLIQVRGRVIPPASGQNNTFTNLPTSMPTLNRTQSLMTTQIQPTGGVQMNQTTRATVLTGASREVAMYDLPAGITSVEISGIIAANP